MNDTATHTGAAPSRAPTLDPDVDTSVEVELQANPRNVQLEAMADRQEAARIAEIQTAVDNDPGLPQIRPPSMAILLQLMPQPALRTKKMCRHTDTMTARKVFNPCTRKCRLYRRLYLPIWWTIRSQISSINNRSSAVGANIGSRSDARSTKSSTPSVGARRGRSGRTCSKPSLQL